MSNLDTCSVTQVVIHDCLMGTGKSSRMIDTINNSPSDQRWIVVVPFLKECHRYAGTICDPDTEENQHPKRDDKGNTIYTGNGCNASGRRFEHPRANYLTKVEHIAKLVNEGKDIVTTHAALKLFTPDTVKDIRDSGYRLVIDEELECIKPHPVKAYRRKMLLTSQAVYEDELGLLRWNPDFPIDDIREVDSNGYSWDMQIKSLCDNGSLVLIEDEKGERDLFMWEYPIEFLKAFDQIDILSYMFEGSIFHKYLSYYNINFKISKGIQLHSSIKDMINIVDSEKMNRIGNRKEALGVTDQRRYTKDSLVASAMRNNLTNYFKNSTYCKSEPDQRLWTCLKDALPIFKGAGYTKRHIAHNTKAVNDYKDTHHIAYIFNANIHPEPYKYLSNRGDQFVPSTERYALSELLQWIYRSRIRLEQPITLYIPSSRMRHLLIDWMEGQYL